MIRPAVAKLDFPYFLIETAPKTIPTIPVMVPNQARLPKNKENTKDTMPSTNEAVAKPLFLVGCCD